MALLIMYFWLLSFITSHHPSSVPTAHVVLDATLEVALPYSSNMLLNIYKLLKYELLFHTLL